MSATVLVSRPRSDALPEYSDFNDTGCDLFRSCLSCPLPRCRYDEPGGAAAILRQMRDTNMQRMAAEGLSVDELAERFEVSRRTVFRVLSAAKAACDCPRGARACPHGDEEPEQHSSAA